MSGRSFDALPQDRAGQADALNDTGVLAESRGDFARALAAYQSALRLRRDLGDERQLAQSYDNVGYIYFLQGEYDHALVYWQQALELHRKGGEAGGLLASTQNMGFLQLAQGRWAEAMKSFVAALDTARQTGSRTGEAVSHGNIGVLQQYDGHPDAAAERQRLHARSVEPSGARDVRQRRAQFVLRAEVLQRGCVVEQAVRDQRTVTTWAMPAW